MKIAAQTSIFFLLVFLSISCDTKSSQIITMKTYLPVENGETREEILKKFGEPVSIILRDDGVEIFKYIERFSLYGEVVESRAYYFYIKDGKVIGKIAQIQDRPDAMDADQ
jgi:outer membrane protein assembly factor BamE (lipoprotein component of BamABCDE complex)